MNAIRLYRQPRSPYWFACFKEWQSDGSWKRVFRSTKSTDPKQAEAVALTLASGALEIGGGTTALSLKDAQRMVGQLLKAAGLPFTTQALTWDQWSPRWRALQEGAVAAQSAKMYRSYCGKLSTFLGADAARLPLAAITGERMQAFHDWLRAPVDEGGQALAFGTTKNCVTTIAAAFESAREHGFCSLNPAKLIRFKGDSKRETRNTFTPAEIHAVLRTAEPHWRRMTLLGLCTAQRIQDCARMTWEMITIKGGKWELAFLPGKTARSGKVVTIPLVSPLLEELQAVPKAQRTGLLCQGIVVSHASTEFIALLVKAGVVVPKIQRRRNWSVLSFHSLRHTLTSWLKAAGVDQETRMKITGHQTESAHAVYTHIEVAAIGAALAKALSGR